MENILNLSKIIFNKSIFIIFFYIIINSEIVIKNNKKKQDIIISLSPCKENIKSHKLDRLIKSIINQTFHPSKILLSINKKYINYMSNYLISLSKENIIEVIVVNEDLKKFNKYYYIPDKYKSSIIIKYFIFIFPNLISF